MSIKVHNGDLYVETMQEADWSPSSAQKDIMKKEQINETRKQREVQRAVQDYHRRQQLIGPHSTNKSSHPHGIMGKHRHSGYDTESMALMQYKAESASAKRACIMEGEFHGNMDVVSHENSRRAQERALRKAAMFEEKFADFMDRNQRIMEESLMYEDTEKVRKRSRRRLYQDWMANVFLPMQNEINNKIHTNDIDEMRKIRNEQFDDFILEINRRNNLTNLGAHMIHSKRIIEPKNYTRRDIQSYTDQQPTLSSVSGTRTGRNTEMRKSALSETLSEETTVRYHAVDIAMDPLKNRRTREMTVDQKDTLTDVIREIGDDIRRKRNWTDGMLYTSSEISQSDDHGTRDNSCSRTSNNSNYYLLPPIPAFSTSAIGQAQQRSVSFNNNKSIIIRNPAVAVAESKCLPKGGDIIFKYCANNSLFDTNNKKCEKSVTLSRSALVNVPHWSHMEETPHCRYSLDSMNPLKRPTGTNKEYMRSNVVMDHYGSYSEAIPANAAFPGYRGKRTKITQVVRDRKHPSDMKSSKE